MKVNEEQQNLSQNQTDDSNRAKENKSDDNSKDKNWYDYDRADSGIVVKIGPFRLFYQNYYTAISLSLDVLVGTLYFTGSILSLFDQTAQYSTYLFILGGFLFVARPVVKLIDNFRHYARSERRKAFEENYFNRNQFFGIKHYNDLPSDDDSEENLGQEYHGEYYHDKNSQ